MKLGQAKHLMPLMYLECWDAASFRATWAVMWNSVLTLVPQTTTTSQVKLWDRQPSIISEEWKQYLGTLEIGYWVLCQWNIIFDLYVSMLSIAITTLWNEVYLAQSFRGWRLKQHCMVLWGLHGRWCHGWSVCKRGTGLMGRREAWERKRSREKSFSLINSRLENSPKSHRTHTAPLEINGLNHPSLPRPTSCPNSCPTPYHCQQKRSFRDKPCSNQSSVRLWGCS